MVIRDPKPNPCRQKTLAPKRSITNMVLMGMGEPLLNYENTVKAIELMTYPDAFKFSSRRVTLSTAGLSPTGTPHNGKSPFRLAISLNATRKRPEVA